MIENGSNEIRYPKQDVFRLHHKQKALIVDGTNSLRGTHSGNVKARDHIWIKRNLKEEINLDVKENRRECNVEFINGTEDYSKNRYCTKSIDRNEEDNIFQHNFEPISQNENDLIKQRIMTNTSFHSLPYKKRKIGTEFLNNDNNSPTRANCKPQEVQDVYCSGNEFFWLAKPCEYQCINCSNTQCQQSKKEEYTSMKNYNQEEVNEKGEKSNLRNTNKPETGIHNNSAQTVPSGNPNECHNVKILSHLTRNTLPPDTGISLPKDSPDNLEKVYDDNKGKTVGCKSRTNFNVNNLKETCISKDSKCYDSSLYGVTQKDNTPPCYDSSLSSIRKWQSSIKTDSLTSNNIHYSSSKTCVKYRNPLFISSIAFSFITIMTFSVLYWNWYETMHRRMTKNPEGPILDHWGKVRIYIYMYIYIYILFLSNKYTYISV